MLKNYITTALRNIRRHWSYSLINFTGLTVGLAGCLLMLIHVAHELNFDRHHPDADRIHRVAAVLEARGRTSPTAMLPALPPLEREIPGIEISARLFSYSWREKALVARGERSFYEDGFFLAEPSLLEIFDFDFIQGDAAALDAIDAVLLSHRAASKLFPDDNPLGQVISVKNLGRADFVVAGVFRDMPAASHFHADYIVPLSAGENLFWPGFLRRHSGWVYLRRAPGAKPADLESKLPAFFEKHLGESARFYTPFLQPLTGIHLRSHLSGEIEPNSDIRQIMLFSLLALVILLTAGFNYVNLATARSAERALEVGLRKVVGAGRRRLVTQFLGEALATSLLTLPPALLLVAVLRPAFAHLVQRDLSFGLLTRPAWLAAAAGAALIAGLLAGIYPALVLSSHHPIHVLQRRPASSPSRAGLRGGLVVVQSAVSAGLIIITLVVTGQMRFISRRDLGFRAEHVITIPMKDEETVRKYAVIKSAFTRNPVVRAVSAADGPLFDSRGRHRLWREGLEDGSDIEVIWNVVDYDILASYGLELAAGRGFSPDFASDEMNAYLINQSAARAFGWDRPVGRRLQLSNKGLKNPVFGSGRVIGVVKDFHHSSLHDRIEPMVMNVYPEMFREIVVRVDGARFPDAIDFMSGEWKRIVPGRPLEFGFLDDRVEALYREDRRIGAVLSWSTGLSLFVAMLGLFGLGAFAAARRRREIGIRKVMGASVREIMVLLSRDFARRVLIANLLAWPAAGLAARAWLRGFAYRIPLSAGIFALALAASLLISLLTVSVQSLRAARADPADVIRYE